LFRPREPKGRRVCEKRKLCATRQPRFKIPLVNVSGKVVISTYRRIASESGQEVNIALGGVIEGEEVYVRG